MKRNKVKLFDNGEIEFYIDEQNQDCILDFSKGKVKKNWESSF